jgi:hypothetical protein
MISPMKGHLLRFPASGGEGGATGLGVRGGEEESGLIMLTDCCNDPRTGNCPLDMDKGT